MCQEVCCLHHLTDPASLADWRCFYLCSKLIPSVTEKSVIFVKELSFPQTAPTDDAFFQPELGWSVLGSLGRTWTVVDWSEGSRSSGLNLLALDVALLCKNKKEGGSARASPVVAPMPKSVLSLE